jgi:ferredoxin
MKASVDDERCAGHGVCGTLCPGVFTLTDEGYSVVAEPEVPAELEDAALAASRNCPEGAISVS